jgi:hypothetical protein
VGALAHIDGDHGVTPAAPGARDRSPAARVAVAGGVASIVFAGVLAVSLARPAAAHAGIPVIGPVIEGVGKVGHTILHPADAAVEAFVKVLQAIFGGIEAKLIASVISALLSIPNFDNGHVAQLEQTTVAISAGMLTAVLTLSLFRYYITGLTDHGSGGFEAIQSFVRVTGAVGFIILWPGLFNEIVQFPRMFNQALLGSGSVQHNVALLFDAALVTGGGAFALGTGVGLIFLIVIGFIAALVFIALLWMKVLLSVMLMFLYVSMPLVVVVWPVPELSWLAGAAMKALGVALIVPCVWAILFALSAAINADILTWVPTHSVIDTLLVRPLAGITLMILCLTIPRFLMRTAMIGPHGQTGGGRMWRTVTIGLLGARTVSGAARGVAAAAAEGNPGAQRMISALPSGAPPGGAGEGNLAARMVFGRSGFSDTGQAAAGSGGTKGAGASAEGTGEEKASGKQGAAEALSRKQASVSVPGIDTPQFDWETANTAGKTMHSASRLSPPSSGAVAQAMGEFSPETQRGLADFNSANPLKLREFAAQHLHSESLSAQQRDALVTIGSARGEAVEVGMNQAIRSLDAPATTSSASTAAAAPDHGASGTSTPPAGPSPALSEQPPHTPPSGASQPTPPAGQSTPGRGVAATPAAASGRGTGVTPPQPPTPPVEQPRTADGAGSGPASPPSRDLPDIEPFLD